MSPKSVFNHNNIFSCLLQPGRLEYLSRQLKSPSLLSISLQSKSSTKKSDDKSSSRANTTVQEKSKQTIPATSDTLGEPVIPFNIFHQPTSTTDCGNRILHYAIERKIHRYLSFRKQFLENLSCFISRLQLQFLPQYLI